MEGDRTHLKPPTLRVKRFQHKYFSCQIPIQLRENSIRDKLSLNASKLMSFGFNQIKGDNKMLKSFPFNVTKQPKMFEKQETAQLQD